VNYLQGVDVQAGL